MAVDSMFWPVAPLTTRARCPTLRDFCPWCGSAPVPVLYTLCECKGTAQGREALLTHRPLASAQDLVQFLFDLNAALHTPQACIYYENEEIVNFPRSPESEGL